MVGGLGGVCAYVPAMLLRCRRSRNAKACVNKKEGHDRFGASGAEEGMDGSQNMLEGKVQKNKLENGKRG